MLRRWLSAGIATRRLVVAFCIVVTLVALIVRYPDAFRDANEAARANARLDNLDRYLGGGNSVLPAQSIALEAKGWIPPDGTFTVVVGPPRPGWPALATQASVDTYLRYFLLPRRASSDAPWVVCLGCDHGAYPGARTVWEDHRRSTRPRARAACS